VWGTPLDEHLRVTNREIALPLEFCVRALLKNGTKEEGLFRIAGGPSITLVSELNQRVTMQEFCPVLFF
jgi:hypothetical protein